MTQNGTERAIGQLQGRIEGLEKNVDEVKTAITALAKKHDENHQAVNDYIQKQKGERRIVAIISGLAGSFMAGVATFIVKDHM